MKSPQGGTTPKDIVPGPLCPGETPESPKRRRLLKGIAAIGGAFVLGTVLLACQVLRVPEEWGRLVGAEPTPTLKPPTPEPTPIIEKIIVPAGEELPGWVSETKREDIARQEESLLAHLSRWNDEEHFPGLVDPRSGIPSDLAWNYFIENPKDENSGVVVAFAVVDSGGNYPQGTVILPVDLEATVTEGRLIIAEAGQPVPPTFFTPEAGGILPEGVKTGINWDFERNTIVAVDHRGQIIAWVNPQHINPEGNKVPDWEFLVNPSIREYVEQWRKNPDLRLTEEEVWSIEQVLAKGLSYLRRYYSHLALEYGFTDGNFAKDARQIFPLIARGPEGEIRLAIVSVDLEKTEGTRKSCGHLFWLNYQGGRFDLGDKAIENILPLPPADALRSTSERARRLELMSLEELTKLLGEKSYLLEGEGLGQGPILVVTETRKSDQGEEKEVVGWYNEKKGWRKTWAREIEEWAKREGLIEPGWTPDHSEAPWIPATSGSLEDWNPEIIGGTPEERELLQRAISFIKANSDRFPLWSRDLVLQIKTFQFSNAENHLAWVSGPGGEVYLGKIKDRLRGYNNPERIMAILFPHEAAHILQKKQRVPSCGVEWIAHTLQLFIASNPRIPPIDQGIIDWLRKAIKTRDFSHIIPPITGII